MIKRQSKENKPAIIWEDFVLISSYLEINIWQGYWGILYISLEGQCMRSSRACEDTCPSLKHQFYEVRYVLKGEIRNVTKDK